MNEYYTYLIIKVLNSGCACVHVIVLAVGVGKSTFIQTYIEDAYVENVRPLLPTRNRWTCIDGAFVNFLFIFPVTLFLCNTQAVPSVVEPIQFDSRLGKIEFHDSGEDVAQAKECLHERIQRVRCLLFYVAENWII